MEDWKSKPDSYWKEKLTEEQYQITRKKATEKPFSGNYCHSNLDGVYHCVCCDSKLFDSRHKYDSQSGWPSFSDLADEENIETQPDHSLDRERTEVLCKVCGAHLGHVFEDGPPPTGLRYCINSLAIKIKEDS